MHSNNKLAAVFAGLTLLVMSSASAQSFNDVPTDYWAYSFIETFAANGITA